MKILSICVKFDLCFAGALCSEFDEMRLLEQANRLRALGLAQTMGKILPTAGGTSGLNLVNFNVQA